MDNTDYYAILFFGGLSVGFVVLVILDMLYMLG
jgi:hypothetical protein